MLIKTSHGHLLLLSPDYFEKFARFQNAKNKAYRKRFLNSNPPSRLCYGLGTILTVARREYVINLF